MLGEPCIGERALVAFAAHADGGDTEAANSSLHRLLLQADIDASIVEPLLHALSRRTGYVNSFRKTALANELVDRFAVFMAALDKPGGRRLANLLAYFTLLLFLRRIDAARRALQACATALSAPTLDMLDFLLPPEMLLRDFDRLEFPLESKLGLPEASEEALAAPPAEDCRVLLAAAGAGTTMVPPSHVLDPFGTLDPAFRFDLPLAVPAMHMTCLRGVATVAAGAMLTRRRAVLLESVYREQFPVTASPQLHRKSVVKPGSAAGHVRFQFNTHANVRVVPEPCMMLATERKFFATWMIHQFPRLHYAARLQVPGLKYVINKNINANCLEMLGALTIAPEDIIELDPGVLHVFDALYVPTSPAFEWDWCRPETHLVFDRLRPAGRRPTGPRAIYISRRDTTRKKAENDEDVARVLERRGFTVVVPGQMSFADKAACFADARVIAGAVGSGQFNALLAAPGCNLIHLGNPMTAPLMTASLARAIGGGNSYVFGRFLEPVPAEMDPLTRATFASANFEVDLESLDALAAEVVSSLPEPPAGG